MFNIEQHLLPLLKEESMTIYYWSAVCCLFVLFIIGLILASNVPCFPNTEFWQLNGSSDNSVLNKAVQLLYTVHETDLYGCL
jgi:hypothetical protein